MPPKKKKPGPAKKKMSPEEEAALKAGEINDIDDDTYKFNLRKEARKLEEQILREEQMAGLYQAERQRANYFWIVAKKELEDKQADGRNKDRELQDLKEKHEIQLKVYQQRLKHLLFQNLDQLTELKKEAELTLKNQEDEHRINEREPKYDARALKIQKKEQEVRQKDYLRALEKTKMTDATKVRQEYERETAEIKLRYNHRMDLLRKEMEDKRKKIISQIENKKNQAIHALTEKHSKKYQKIKLYYQEITNTNFEFIKQLKEDVNELKKKEKDDLKMLYEAKLENEQYSEPLKKAVQDVKRLKNEEAEYNEAKAQLQNIKKLILEKEKVHKDIEWKNEVRLQQLKYLEREKQELFEHFNKVVNEIHQKTGLKNLIFEKKLETIKETIETKDAQLNQLLAAAKIDPKSVGVIKSTLEEVENMKNEAIKDIQLEMKKIREAHSNMVKTYQGKLSEFGIPVEELGFDPLVPANV